MFFIDVKHIENLAGNNLLIQVFDTTFKLNKFNHKNIMSALTVYYHED